MEDKLSNHCSESISPTEQPKSIKTERIIRNSNNNTSPTEYNNCSPEGKTITITTTTTTSSSSSSSSSSSVLSPSDSPTIYPRTGKTSRSKDRFKELLPIVESEEIDVTQLKSKTKIQAQLAQLNWTRFMESTEESPKASLKRSRSSSLDKSNKKSRITPTISTSSSSLHTSIELNSEHELKEEEEEESKIIEETHADNHYFSHPITQAQPFFSSHLPVAPFPTTSSSSAAAGGATNSRATLIRDILTNVPISQSSIQNFGFPMGMPTAPGAPFITLSTSPAVPINAPSIGTTVPSSSPLLGTDHGDSGFFSMDIPQYHQKSMINNMPQQILIKPKLPIATVYMTKFFECQSTIPLQNTQQGWTNILMNCCTENAAFNFQFGTNISSNVANIQIYANMLKVRFECAREVHYSLQKCEELFDGNTYAFSCDIKTCIVYDYANVVTNGYLKATLNENLKIVSLAILTQHSQIFMAADYIKSLSPGIPLPIQQEFGYTKAELELLRANSVAVSKAVKPGEYIL